jgi:protein-disulfide isomerase
MGRLEMIPVLQRPSAVLYSSILMLALGSTAAAQTPDDIAAIRNELAALREAQDATRKDVEAIRLLLEQAMGPRPAGAAPAPPSSVGGNVAELKIAGRPAKGSPKALITLIEFSDYACPFCAQYATQTYPQIDREYVRTNKIRYVFKNYPIAQLHPNAMRAHEAAACAGDQGRYWEMHAQLFADQRTLTLEGFTERAVALGLDAAKLRSCIEGPAHDALIRADIAEAESGGVRGTPVFVLALTDPKGEIAKPLRVLVGAQPFQAFKEALDAALAQAAALPTGQQ